MKSKLFKRTVSVLSAVSMISTIGLVPIIAHADGTTYYSQDYEAVTDAATVMTSQNAQGNVSIGTDRTNYLQYVGNNSTNSRSSYSDFSADMSAVDKYIVEFDAALASGSRDASEFVLRTGSIPAANTSYGKTNYVFKLSAAGNSNVWTVNDVETSTAALTNGAWYHYKLYVDKGMGMTSVTATDGEGNAAIDKLIVPVQGDASKLTGLYWLNGRYSNTIKIDNIVVRDVAEGDEFGSIGEESLAKVEFSEGTATITQPDEGTSVDYKYVINVEGNYGGDLAEIATYNWTWAGLDKEDGYVTITTDKNVCNVNVRNGVSNYYVPLKCEVTYGDVTMTASYPLAILGVQSAGSSQIAPKSGYPADMNEYGDSLIGYKGTSNGLTTQDVILNSWSIYGSNGAREMELVKEDDNKYIKFSSNNGGGSTIANYQFPAQSSQYIVKIGAKISDNTSFGVYSNTPNNSNAVAEAAFTCSSGSLKAGTESINGINAGEYYDFVMSADPSVGTYTVAAYSADGTKIGETAEIPVGTGAMKYFCISGNFPVYLKSFSAYTPTLSTIAVNSSADVVRVPEAGEAASTVDLSAALADAEGIKVTGAVDWALADEYANVELEATGSQTAVLKINEGASGTIEVTATKDGKQAAKTIQLTTSSNVVAFTKSTSSITIPFAGEESIVNEFAAETRDGSGNPIEGGNITYTLLGKDGVTETTVKGVTFENGKMTVEAGASPAVVYVRATNEEGLATSVKVNIHGLSFAFGSAEPEDGYTQVADTQYTERLEYGFATTDMLIVNEASVTGSADYRFKATVPNGNYVVNVDTTSANMTSEVIETITDSTGITKTGTQFSVAVCDGVLDLTFRAASELKTLTISQAAAKPLLEKPMLYAIGDSTTKNSGEIKNDLYGRTYCSWGNAVNSTAALPDCFSGFANHGMAGRNSISFYNEARVEAVLLSVNPGDYVTVNMGINGAESGDTFTNIMKNYYVQGIIQRGATPIILTATPDGPGYGNSAGKYNAETGKFEVACPGRARNPLLRNIASELGLHVIDVGQMGEDYYNSLTDADVKEYLDGINAAKGTSFSTVYDAVHYWQPDHNHYIEPLAGKIAEMILGKVEAIVTGEEPDPTIEPTNDPTTPEPSTEPTNDPTTPEPSTEPTNDPTTPEPSTEPTNDPTTPKPSIEPGKILAYAADGVVIEAAYDESGRLTSMSTVAAVKKGDEVMEFPEIAGVRHFVWNSLTGMVPVSTELIDEPTPKPEVSAEPSTESKYYPQEAEVNYKAGAIVYSCEAFDMVAGDCAAVTGLDTDSNVLYIKNVNSIKTKINVSAFGSETTKTSEDIRSALEITPKKDGYLKVTLKLNNTKKVGIADKTTMTAVAFKGNATGTDFDRYVLQAEVKKGQTYLVGGVGTSPYIYSVELGEMDPNTPVDPDPVTPTEPPVEEIPKPKDGEWVMSAAYSLCPEGTELMKGLTTLFGDTKNNGKYITSDANGKFSDGAATGTALKYVAWADGTLTVSFTGLGTPSTDGSPKTVYIVQEGGKQAEPLASVANETQDKMDGTISAEVTAGTTYYIYGAGTKACFNGATFAAK